MIAFVLACKSEYIWMRLLFLQIKKCGRRAYNYSKYGLNYFVKLLNINNMEGFKKVL